MPADAARIDIYGFTGTTAPVRGEFLAQAERLAVIPVAPAPTPDAPAPTNSDAAAAGARQGMEVTVRDVLTPDRLVPKPPPARVNPERTPAAATAASPPAGPPLPRRFYMAIAFSDRGRSSPQGTVADLPLFPVPPPPGSLQVSYSENAVTLAWEPSGGLLGFLLDRTLPAEAAPFDDLAAPPATAPTPLAAELPPGPTQYNVYRAASGDPLALPERISQSPWEQARPSPLNPAPLAGLAFADAVEFERTQCYAVRAVRGSGAALVEGDPSPVRCVDAVDTFPPAAPANVTAVAAEGSISLIWEPNAEADLAGYVVLRGEAGSATLQPLTERPIAEPRYTDQRVTPGQRYIYAVVAVDDRVPVANVSVESARIEETAR
jgi:hypothetical protein